MSPSWPPPPAGAVRCSDPVSLYLRLQAVRLEVLKNLLQKRKETQKEQDTERLDAKWARLQSGKEEELQQIRRELIKGAGNGGITEAVIGWRHRL